ncbi:amidohydrolase family protein [Rhodobacteraceae bacterium B1Z28]|uniref:Amidohydrolase family protein n=1 Tax=Ruegeria haliotis TaxID=2747601 RepID=A0ABX2PS72_9RHOB|nr:amidohydrolase family protein [Ruegeria haliotis]NVO57009.1 amidohydrolase family protein [Ruegeria haliotis]
MADMLLWGRWVVVSADDVREDSAVLLRGGRVAEIGKAPEMRARHAGIPEHGGADCTILPGLINAHHHCYGIELVNQKVKDDFLEPWMFCGPSMVGLSPYLSSAHSALRLLKTGVTAVVDMCSAGVTRESGEVRLLEKAQAYRDAGLRAAIAPGERWQNRIVHGAGEEAGFLATLPQNLRDDLARNEAGRARLSPDAYFELMAALVPQGDGLRDFWFGPTGPQWTPDAVLARVAQEAERLDTRIQTHALESFYEGLESQQIRGKHLMQHFADQGILSERLSLAHVVWAGPQDIEELARSGVQVSHNPSSNLRLRSGVAPIADMCGNGVSVALGMDGTTLGGAEDIFTEMRLALALNTPPHRSAKALNARDVLALATQGGARVLGRAHELGQLQLGYCADAVVLDLSRPMSPWCAPDVDPIELIVGRATAADVRDVIVNGALVVAHGTVTGLNETQLLQKLRAELEQSPPDDAALTLARNLRPYLLDWYAHWEQAGTVPVTRYGAPFPMHKTSPLAARTPAPKVKLGEVT